MNWRLLLIVFSYTMLATSLAIVWSIRNTRPEPELFWSDDVRREVQELVEDRYVDPIDDTRAEELFDASMWGYVGQLDPFSRYFDADGKRELEEDTRGSFGGIGVQVRSFEHGMLVTSVRIGGPADRAGVVPGDTILRVDGESLAGGDVSEMISHVKGAPGTVVVLSLRSSAGDVRDAPVTRAQVELDSVPRVRLFEGDMPVGYFRISGFSEGTGREVRRAVDDLVRRGAQALIMDLRHNVGGVVSGAVNTASVFLPPDMPICHTRGRDREFTTEGDYTTLAEPGERPVDLPLLVLVNDESASASEILAGALQDHGRALLAGTRTYGKFLVQTLFDLRSREAVVRITTSRYETPKGRSAQRHLDRGLRGGMVPDVRLLLDSDTARDAVARQFAQDSDERIWRVMEEERGKEPPVDPQLEEALSLVRGAPAPAEPILRARLP